ncbi:MAG TPA: hypothetical protein VD772_11235, partial [Anseongella sp.]|nr:hypothetical protein [Anseongella sp.]
FDTVRTLADVDSLIWKKYLERHLFRGSNRLSDYTQLDLNLKPIYPGDNYYSLNNTILNIGVIHHDANGVKYAGYRQLAISYIPDTSRPEDNWFTIRVSSSDIKPRNGVVHTLSREKEEGAPPFSSVFGFDFFEFLNDVAMFR